MTNTSFGYYTALGFYVRAAHFEKEKHMKKILMYTVLYCLLALSASHTSAAEVPKPSYSVGEWCEYRDKYRNTVRQTVTEIAPDGAITMVWEGEQTPKQVRVYNPNLELVKRNERTFSPAWSSPPFPLRDGATGHLGKFTYERGSGATTSAVSTLTATKREQLTVPAGTYEALTAEVVVSYARGNGRQNEFHISQSWALDPSVRWPLKHVFFDYGNKRSESNKELELVRCGT